MRRNPHTRATRLVSVVATLVLLAGLGTLGYVGYLLFGTSWQQHGSQTTLKKQFRAEVAAPTSTLAPRTTKAPHLAPDPKEGSVIGLLRIPRLGKHYEQAIVEGTMLRDLQKAPGHYSNTPLFGEPGNVGVAGHRTTYGAPFYHLDEMRKGDVITVETRIGTFTYRMLSRQIVPAAESSVLRPDPTLPIAQPKTGTGHFLTLTTCHPIHSARQRMIIHAEQVAFTPLT